MRGDDLKGFNRIKKIFQRNYQWYFTDIFEDDETIRYHKRRIVAITKVTFTIFGLYMLVVIIFFI